jgi:MFS transporter, DHA2 family, glioxin efflux transporter
VVSVSIAACITGVAVSWIRYYNPMFLVGGICFSTGAGLLLTMDANTPLSTRIGFQALMGLGVGFVALANVAPCQTYLDEKDHSVANGLTFFFSLLGA